MILIYVIFYIYGKRSEWSGSKIECFKSFSNRQIQNLEKKLETINKSRIFQTVNVSHIKYLSLNYTYSLFSSDVGKFQKTASEKFLPLCKSLEILLVERSFSENLIIESEKVKEIYVHNCCLLEKITFTGTSCETLKIRECDKMNYIEAVSNCCSKLREFDLFGDNMYTSDDMLSQTLNDCKSLQSIYISKNHNLQQVCLYLPLLHTLLIEECWSLRNVDLRCPHLKQFSLSTCSSISEISFVHYPS